ncbi:protein YIPF1-like isoform X1 [Amphibalanus amphitrite]|uniref:protein YIPF1-like isoform X1 n=1 Tax=Amphibalanus amphitrite TaxID=1232801 RepID=UPI001C919EE6|nr:protein YIPF1-like isoform X1 [Amphibalanus amphitrite]XP_043222728.1 protein YIPF1-like isoform X1 [Amphibalanus amphitrite]XP_043222729.1 protein YIPF1-like isoform X1 [Amphibalanus amphitrite]XP_043222730.1 protein YIPF1-like isoform X1 [Amphibalanus amphitrite]XP_043222731.1 protein YIPF1-like isoform X1 [Amphibalanus amphitrite]XP_043222732.1 protein YIPF1-like isoform X1 [Amphibalanus amphitrite]XP_043222733.1 protein YIPF1-like isoform X1 [Amphibalanus amphitrite]
MDPSKQSSGNFDFQDFPVDSTLVELDTSDQQTHTFKQFPDSAVDDDLEGTVEENKLLGEEKPAGGGGAIWTVEYYRRYFNVDTSDVRDRCLWSMVPKPGTNFLKDRLQQNPDLYGPFWIGVTLVISIAVMGNLANYLQVAAAGDRYHWRYDFHKLTLAATVVFCYSCLVPIALWAVFWWRGVQATVTLLQLVCLYGYSLTVYIPISVLCASGVWQLQWALMLAGFAVSGAVLAASLWSALGEEQRRLAIAVTAVVLLLHLALAAGFLLYFFRSPVPATDVQATTAAAAVAAATAEKTAAPASPAAKRAASDPAAPAGDQGAAAAKTKGAPPPDAAGGGGADAGAAAKPAQR